MTWSVPGSADLSKDEAGDLHRGRASASGNGDELPRSCPSLVAPFGGERPARTHGRVLVVDDDDGVRELLRRSLRANGHTVEVARSGEEALDHLRSAPPDLVLLDMQLPGASGFDILAEIRRDNRTRLIPVVMITGAATQQWKLKAIEAGVTDFLGKPFSMEELSVRARALLELKFTTDALEAAEDVLIALAATIEARDPYTYGHGARVALYAKLLGERIGIRGAPLQALCNGALFHDFGKIAVRDRVLLKPGRLTPDEFNEIRRHPQQGGDLLRSMKTLGAALEVVYHHHERMDGSGYPAGLAGEAIPVTARAVAIVDVFDALTTARVYRGALPREEAVRILHEEVAKGWWDRELVGEFLAVLEDLPETDERILRLAGPPQRADPGP